MAEEDPAEPVIRAAGGVVWRDGRHGIELLVVHRARYDDWTLPKGKLDPGESWDHAAVREVFEETGAVVVLGPELASTDYRDGRGRPKRVRYWAMSVATSVPFVPNDEITALEWIPLEASASRLTYPRDVSVVESFTATLPESPQHG